MPNASKDVGQWLMVPFVLLVRGLLLQYMGSHLASSLRVEHLPSLYFNNSGPRIYPRETLARVPRK